MLQGYRGIARGTQRETSLAARFAKDVIHNSVIAWAVSSLRA